MFRWQLTWLLQLQAQEHAAAEDKRQNEAERAELDLEGSGGELLDPQQLGFHEDPEQGAAGMSEDASGVSEDAEDRGENARERGGNAMADEGVERGGSKVEASEEARTSRQEDSDELDVSDEEGNTRRMESPLKPAPTGGDRESYRTGIADVDGVMLGDPFMSEERDVVEMGRRSEGDLSRVAEDNSRGVEPISGRDREGPEVDSAADEVDSPDTIVLGGRSRKERAGSIEVKPVPLADEPPRLVGYRRAKDESKDESTDESTEVSKELDTDGDIDGGDKEAAENDDLMAMLDEEDARPT